MEAPTHTVRPDDTLVVYRLRIPADNATPDDVARALLGTPLMFFHHAGHILRPQVGVPVLLERLRRQRILRPHPFLEFGFLGPGSFGSLGLPGSLPLGLLGALGLSVGDALFGDLRLDEAVEVGGEVLAVEGVAPHVLDAPASVR